MLWVIEVRRLGKIILFYNNQSIMVHIFEYDNNPSYVPLMFFLYNLHVTLM